MLKLSYFSKRLYEQCPAAWEAMYVKHKFLSKGDKRIAYEGSVLHLLFENWMKQSTFEKQWLFDNIDKYILEFLAKERCVFKSELDRQFARQKIVKFVTGTYDIMEREGLIRRALPEYTVKHAFIGDKVQLNVRIDAIYDEKDFLDLFDYKGVGRMAGISYEQLAVYRIAARQEFKKPIRKTAFIMANFNELVHYDSKLWPESRVEDEFLATADKIEAGIFPCTPANWICRDCGIKDTCLSAYDSRKAIKSLRRQINDAERNRGEAAELPPSAFRIEL